MDKINVVYVVNGATKQDVMTGTEVSIQREGKAVHITFPNADGAYLVKFSKKITDLNCQRVWVSYAECDRVEGFKVKSDTSTKVS